MLKKRVEGRQTELTFARKRQRELQMLEGLCDFVRLHYKESSVLLDAIKNRMHIYTCPCTCTCACTCACTCTRTHTHTHAHAHTHAQVLLDAIKNRYASAGHSSLIWASDPKDYTHVSK